MNLDLQSLTVKQLRARAAELGVDDDERVTRSGGHRPTRSNWIEVVEEALEENEPSQADLIREGLVRGLSNEEIAQEVLDAYPDAISVVKYRATRINGVLSAERRSASDWWLTNRDTICRYRPRIKYETPEEEGS